MPSACTRNFCHAAVSARSISPSPFQGEGRGEGPAPATVHEKGLFRPYAFGFRPAISSRLGLPPFFPRNPLTSLSSVLALCSVHAAVGTGCPARRCFWSERRRI